MKKTIKLSRIHCVGCAENLEAKILEVDGVVWAEVDFSNRTVNLNVLNKEVVNEVVKTITKFDSSIKIVDTSDEDKELKKEKTKNIIDIIRMGLTVLFLSLAIFLPKSVYWLKILFYSFAYLIVGYEIIWIALRNIIRGKVLDENFLMTIATIGAFILSKHIEAVMVMLLYTVGEFLQGLAVSSSKKKIKSLLDIKADVATVVTSAGDIIVPVANVKLNDIIRIKAGERVPLDCKVLEGTSSVDAAAITGESNELFVHKGSNILSGSINISGVLLCKVSKTEKDSTVTKIISLVEKASKNKAQTEKFVSRFAKIYTPIVILAAVLIAVIPGLFGFGFEPWLYKSLTFLVVSCPCALVISIPLSFFAGIGVSAKNGILIKGSNFIEMLAKAEIAIFDKTGTLTHGDFEVSSIHATKNSSKEEVLELIAYAESFSNHRIAKSVVKAYGKDINTAWVEDYKEVAGLGVSVRLFMEDCLVGNLMFMKNNNINAPEVKEVGTVVYLAKGGEFVGYIVVADKIKKDSFTVVKKLKDCGVKHVSMFTGDNKNIANSVKEKIGLDSFYAGLLPQDKVKTLGLFENQKIIFVGDGINDAPVIASSDVGVCMGGVGSDAAIEVSDVVLMNDEPSKVVEAVKISKKTMNIVKQNVLFILITKFLVMGLTLFGISGMWLAIFADVGVALLAVLNSLRIMLYKTKNGEKNV